MVVVSPARESKIALAEIQSKLKAVEKLNAEMLVQVRVNSQRLSALERQGTISFLANKIAAELSLSGIQLYITVHCCSTIPPLTLIFVVLINSPRCTPAFLSFLFFLLNEFIPFICFLSRSRQLCSALPAKRN